MNDSLRFYKSRSNNATNHESYNNFCNNDNNQQQEQKNHNSKQYYNTHKTYQVQYQQTQQKYKNQPHYNKNDQQQHYQQYQDRGINYEEHSKNLSDQEYYKKNIYNDQIIRIKNKQIDDQFSMNQNSDKKIQTRNQDDQYYHNERCYNQNSLLKQRDDTFFGQNSELFSQPQYSEDLNNRKNYQVFQRKLYIGEQKNNEYSNRYDKFQFNQTKFNKIQDQNFYQKQFQIKKLGEHQQQGFIDEACFNQHQNQFIHQFRVVFPRLDSYQDLKQIQKQFKPLLHVNNYSSQIQLSPNDIVKLIRPKGLNNLHKAIKYGIWTSLGQKNKDLVVSWDLAQKNQGRVFLIFLPTQSDYIVGIAMMNLKFSITKHFRFWDSEDKFFGLCGLEWIYVKNVKCNDIDSFINESQSVKIQQLLDGAILTLKDSSSIFEQFYADNSNGSVFDEFISLDIQEDQIREYRNNNPDFEEKFQKNYNIFESTYQSFGLVSNNDNTIDY